MTGRQEMVQGVGAEPDLATLEARSACIDIVASIARLVSSGMPEKTFELFTEDYQLIRDGVTHTRTDLEANARSRRPDGVRRLHFPSQSVFRLVTPDTAETETYVAVYVLDSSGDVPAPRTLVHASDAFARRPDGIWRMSRRTVSVIAGSL
jgi:hypothetical protein